MTEVGQFRAGDVTGINRELERRGLDSRDIITITEVTGRQGVRHIVYYHKEIDRDKKKVIRGINRYLCEV